MQYKTFTASGAITANRVNLKGFCISATAAAVVNIYDGTSASDILVMTINVDTTQTAILNISETGLPMNEAIYIQVASGTVSGTIWFD